MKNLNADYSVQHVQLNLTNVPYSEWTLPRCGRIGTVHRYTSFGTKPTILICREQLFGGRYPILVPRRPDTSIRPKQNLPPRYT